MVKIAALTAGVFLLLYWSRSLANPEDAYPHFHAGFQVYRDGVLLNFDSLEYMHLVSCSEDHENNGVDEQIEKVHLHNQVGDVAHVHRDQVTWSDLFINLNVNIDASAIAYINGVITEDVLNKPIQPNDSLVILEGENDHVDEKVANSVSLEKIKTVESMTESCGT